MRTGPIVASLTLLVTVVAGCASRSTTVATTSPSAQAPAPATAPTPAPTAPAPAGAPPPAGTPAAVAHENLNAVVWVQTAVEFRGASLQAYRLAQHQLDVALDEPTWTAALEQKGDVSKLPPAVVLDLDETVFDNSPFQARSIADQLRQRSEGRNAVGFDPVAWDAWCAEAQADAIPGAVAFLQYARSKGVTTFFISNRTAPLEEPTRRNLQRLGVDTSGSEDTVLLRNERPEWSASDKAARRASVARTHRILLLVGDDLGDFVAAEGAVADRDARVEPHAALWGTKWIVVSNPMYGSWERAVLAAHPGVGPIEVKTRALKAKR